MLTHESTFPIERWSAAGDLLGIGLPRTFVLLRFKIGLLHCPIEIAVGHVLFNIVLFQVTPSPKGRVCLSVF